MGFDWVILSVCLFLFIFIFCKEVPCLELGN